jgi:hypothetical protein
MTHWVYSSRDGLSDGLRNAIRLALNSWRRHGREMNGR